MQHRGVEFTVLPTIPKGWRWTIKRGQSDLGGSCYSREDAVRKARHSIENLIRRRVRMQNVQQQTNLSQER